MLILTRLRKSRVRITGKKTAVMKAYRTILKQGKVSEDELASLLSRKAHSQSPRGYLPERQDGLALNGLGLLADRGRFRHITATRTLGRWSGVANPAATAGYS